MENKKMDRKQAIKKMGKYAGLTALGTFAILNPKKAQAFSPCAGRPCNADKGDSAFFK